MFAVIKTGGKQYKVAPNDVLRVEKIAGEPGDLVELGAVLAIGGEAGVTLGAPLVEGAMVAAEVVEQGRADKIIVFKKKRRKNHRRRNGHRQHQTVLRVTEILTDGKKPGKASSKAKAAKATPAKAEPAPEAETADSVPADKAAPTKAAAKKAPAEKAPAKKKAAPKKAAAEKAPAKKAAKKSAKKEE
jgi:large subunit ribosomal protein L21